MTSDLQHRILNVWLRMTKGPSTPLMMCAHRLKVRRIRGLTTMVYLVGISMRCASNEVTQRMVPKHLLSSDYEKWMR